MSDELKDLLQSLCIQYENCMISKTIHDAYKRYEEIEAAILARDEEQRREIARLTTMTYCAYCGTEFPLDDKAASHVEAHIFSCELHPVSTLVKENKEQRREIERQAIQLEMQEKETDEMLRKILELRAELDTLKGQHDTG